VGGNLSRLAIISGSLYLVAAAGFVAGSFLPWVTAPNLFGDLTARAIDSSDGVVTIGLGLVLGATGLHVLSTGTTSYRIAIGEMVVVTGLLFYLWDSLDDRIDELSAEIGITAQFGAGFWIMGVAAVVGWAAALRIPRAAQGGEKAGSATDRGGSWVARHSVGGPQEISDAKAYSLVLGAAAAFVVWLFFIQGSGGI
jgi:hypothetical protein